jgi:hypothetical protein
MTEPHSTSLYSPAGRGILYIAEWSATTPPTDPDDYVQIGNCPSMEVEPTMERRPHYSSQSGLRTRDLNPVVQTEYTLNFECDEIAASNLQRFFMGTLDAASRTIAGLQRADQEYALKFISDNPIGPNQEYRFWRVTIGPSGPMQLIGDEYQQLSFTGEGLADSANHVSSPYFDIKYITTTTTSTTTTTTTA